MGEKIEKVEELLENKHKEESLLEEHKKELLENEHEDVPLLTEGEENIEIKSRESEYLEKLVRLQAEFANFQKRTEREKRELLVNANSSLIYQLLDVLDNFELSLKHTDDEGIKLIYNELFEILKKQGLSAVSVEGKFNPEFHEALAKEEGTDNGTILEEFQKGYLLNGKLLRASKVKISVVLEDD